MKVEQFVMAYSVEQDRVRAMMPDGFTSLRPVLRINTEIRDEGTADERAYVEFNAPAESEGRRGWLNIGNWEGPEDGISFSREGEDPGTGKAGTVKISSNFFSLEYTAVGIEGGCPAEKDNDGCFFREEDGGFSFRPVETISEKKEFCDCTFAWHFNEGDASGQSIGRTIPAFMEDEKQEYPRQELTAEAAAAIPCRQVLGTYIVRFQRQDI